MASPSVHRFLGLFLFACFLPFTPARLRHQCSDYGLTSDNSHTLPSPPLLASWFHVPKAGLDFGHYLWWYAGMDSDDHEAAMNKVSPQGHKPLTGQPRDCFLLRPATTPLLAMDECGVVTGKLTSKALPSPLLVRSEKNLSIVCKCYNTGEPLKESIAQIARSLTFTHPYQLASCGTLSSASSPCTSTSRGSWSGSSSRPWRSTPPSKRTTHPLLTASRV